MRCRLDDLKPGAALLEGWRLPALLQEAVAFHHQPRHASRFPVEAAIVHVADHRPTRSSSGPAASGWCLSQLEQQFADAVAAILGPGH